MKFCPYCGTQLVAGDGQFCHACGRELPTQRDDVTGAQPAFAPPPVAPSQFAEPIPATSMPGSGEVLPPEPPRPAAVRSSSLAGSGWTTLSPWFWLGCLGLAGLFYVYVGLRLAGHRSLTVAFWALDIAILAGVMNAYLLHRVGRRRLVGFGLGFAVGLAFMWATSLAISGAQGMGHFLPEALTGTRAGASASKGPAGRNPFDEFDPKLGTPKSKPFDQFGVHTDPPKRFREMTVEEELDIQPLDPPQGATPNAKLDLQPLDPAQDAKPWEEYPKQAKDPKDPLGLFEKPATKRK